MTEALPFSDLSPPFLAPINAIPGIRAAWIPRLHSLPHHATAAGRDHAMAALRPFHEDVVRSFGARPADWWRAEQIHGTTVATVPGPPAITAPDGLPAVPAADGLVTATPGILLSIYVADCGAIWLADKATGAVGLLHSGKKGTEGNILATALLRMEAAFGTRPADVTAILGPCIRPPHYETDFAATIARQAEAAGIGEFTDCGENTATDLTRHYSYRMELGKTGRMMAVIHRQPA